RSDVANKAIAVLPGVGFSKKIEEGLEVPSPELLHVHIPGDTSNGVLPCRETSFTKSCCLGIFAGRSSPVKRLSALGRPLRRLLTNRGVRGMDVHVVFDEADGRVESSRVEC